MNPPSLLNPRSSILNSLGRLGRLIRKELREILRDRRTILTLVLMPVLLYPLMGIAFKQFYLSHLAAAATPEYVIGIRSKREGEVIVSYLNHGNQRLAERRAAAPDGKETRPEPDVKYSVPDHFDEAVRDSLIHVGIRVLNLQEAEQNRDEGLALDCELVYLEDSVLGMDAVAYVESRCAAANAAFLEERLKALGIPQRAVPVKMARAPLREPGAKSAISLAAVIPLVLILMTITGAVYPAIDLTAGERERDTLEILMTAPVPRLGLLFSKYVAVVAVALLTALVNLGAMTATLVLTGLAERFGGLSVLTVLEVFGLLVLFAAFFSAVLLILTSFARSFKEAQAYLIPLMLVSLIPGMLGIVPGVKLSLSLALVPLLNIVLLAHDLFEGEAEFGLASVVVLATLLYALLAVALAARVFGSEGVLYGEQGRWRDLFRRAGGPRERGGHGTTRV